MMECCLRGSGRSVGQNNGEKKRNNRPCPAAAFYCLFSFFLSVCVTFKVCNTVNTEIRNMYLLVHVLVREIVRCNVMYCTVLYCTVLYCTVLYCTVLHRKTRLHSMWCRGIVTGGPKDRAPRQLRLLPSPSILIHPFPK